MGDRSSFTAHGVLLGIPGDRLTAMDTGGKLLPVYGEPVFCVLLEKVVDSKYRNVGFMPLRLSFACRRRYLAFAGKAKVPAGYEVFKRDTPRKNRKASSEKVNHVLPSMPLIASNLGFV